MVKFKQIYVDGTFRIRPKGFLQVLNIGGHPENIKIFILVFLIPVTDKSEYLYSSVFTDIKNILPDNNISSDETTKYFIINFEVGLQKAIKSAFLII